MPTLSADATISHWAETLIPNAGEQILFSIAMKGNAKFIENYLQVLNIVDHVD